MGFKFWQKGYKAAIDDQEKGTDTNPEGDNEFDKEKWKQGYKEGYEDYRDGESDANQSDSGKYKRK